MRNTTVTSVNLQTAVLMQVQEFINSGQAFSRYDITSALRQKCNDSLIEIPECVNSNPHSQYRFMIMKDMVDDIFEQLYQNCLVNGLPPLTIVGNDPVRGFRLFGVDSNSVSTAVPASVPTPTNLQTMPGMTQIISAPTPVTPTTTINLTDTEIRRRVGLYMNACVASGKTPTLKQIQSAIKRGNKSTGLSYGEIANMVTSLGFNI